MKKLLLLGLTVTVALVFAEQRRVRPAETVLPSPAYSAEYAGDANPAPNPLVQEMTEARKSGNWTLYNNLLQTYLNQRPLPEDDVPAEVEIKPDQNPIMRWGNDITIYAGNVYYNSWAMLLDMDDEAISVDHYRGDTLRAAVVLPDSTIYVYQSNDNGQTWYSLMGWSTNTDIMEPEIINDPNGTVYHVFQRRGSNNGDVRVITDSLNGGWYGTWIENGTDTVASYSVTTDRSQYPNTYWLFCSYGVALGGPGFDEIKFTRSYDKAQTFDTPVLLQASGSRAPDLAYGYNNCLHETYLYRSGTPESNIRVHARTSYDEGSNWQGSVVITDADTMAKQGPQIAAAHDGSGNIWVVWPHRWTGTVPDYDLRYRWSQDSGATWSSWDFLCSYGNAHEVLPSIAIYDSTTYAIPYVTWIHSDTAWANATTRTSYWTADSFATYASYSDFEPAFTRPAQTFEANGGIPAFAYVGTGGVNVYYDSWSNEFAVAEGEGQTAPGAVLMQNRPNPFRSFTLLEYQVPVSGKVSLRVFNALGQEVAVLVDQYQTAGTHQVNWDASDKGSVTLPKGIYIARLNVGGVVSTRKVIIQ